MEEESLLLMCATNTMCAMLFTLENTYHALHKMQLYRSTWWELSSALTDA